MTIPLAFIYRNSPLYSICISTVPSPELFNEQISTSDKKKGGGTGYCKSASVQRKQVVAQRTLKQVHMRKDLLVDITTKITPMVKVVWERNKNKRKEGKKELYFVASWKEKCWGSPDECPSPRLSPV